VCLQKIKSGLMMGPNRARERLCQFPEGWPDLEHVLFDPCHTV
jgi:hypothetical protein